MNIHEHQAKEILKKFSINVPNGVAIFSLKGIDKKLIEKVKKLILATKFDFETSDDLESILKDADASHFAKDYFEETSEFLRQELQLQGIANYTPTEWINENIKMFTEQHKFHTDYALKNWKEQKL